VPACRIPEIVAFSREREAPVSSIRPPLDSVGREHHGTAVRESQDGLLPGEAPLRGGEEERRVAAQAEQMAAPGSPAQLNSSTRARRP